MTRTNTPLGPNSPRPVYPETTGAEMRLFQNQATTIERGEHRREEEK